MFIKTSLSTFLRRSYNCPLYYTRINSLDFSKYFLNKCISTSCLYNSIENVKVNDHKLPPENSSSLNEKKLPYKLWLAWFSFTGLMIGSFYVYKESKLKELESDMDKKRSLIGKGTRKLLIGGDFEMTNSNGDSVKLASFSGKWSLFYFGFCHCPDVCPEQLEKMLDVVRRVDQMRGSEKVTPVFISIDPERDTPDVVKEYLAEFSGRFLGLTGKPEQVHEIAKSFRIYYSKGPEDKYGDYIVDHAIIMYLVNPEGHVVDYYGQNKSEKEIATAIVKCQLAYQLSSKSSSKDVSVSVT